MPGSAIVVNSRVENRSASALGMVKVAGISPEDSLSAESLNSLDTGRIGTK
jgi:hypothetical protein